MAAGLHGGKAGLDTFADHQHARRRAEPHRAAATRAKHHLRRLYWRLAFAIVGQECAVNADRLTIIAAPNQRYHRRPYAARGMPQTGMEAKRDRRPQANAARGEINADRRALFLLSGFPDGKSRLDSPGVVWIGLVLDRRVADLVR